MDTKAIQQLAEQLAKEQFPDDTWGRKVWSDGFEAGAAAASPVKNVEVDKEKKKWSFESKIEPVADTGDYDSYVRFTNGYECLQTDGYNLTDDQCKQFCELLNLMPDLWSHRLDATEWELSQLKQQLAAKEEAPAPQAIPSAGVKEKLVNYGEKRNVVVESADKDVIICIDKSTNEGFILMYHGLKVLPKAGDKGTIVFERDNRKGHWQYYSKTSK
jgi:hypothetical protein